MKTNTNNTTADRIRYEERYAKWKVVNIKPDTKQKLAELSVMMGTVLCTVPQCTVLDHIVTEYYNKLKNS